MPIMETRSSQNLSRLTTKTTDSLQTSWSAIASLDPSVANNMYSSLASPDSLLVSDVSQSPVTSTGFEKQVMDSLAI